MEELQTLRQQINEIDMQLLSLLAKRFQLVSEIGTHKKVQNIEIQDKQREEEILEALNQKAKEYHLDKNLVQTIWRAIFNQAYLIEQ